MELTIGGASCIYVKPSQSPNELVTPRALAAYLITVHPHWFKAIGRTWSGKNAGVVRPVGGKCQMPVTCSINVCWRCAYFPLPREQIDAVIVLKCFRKSSTSFQERKVFRTFPYSTSLPLTFGWGPDSLGLLRNLYAGQEATVRTGHGTTDWFQIGKGVHQGCILSPCLFNLYAEYIMRNAGLEEAQAGIKIARRNIKNLRNTDNTTLTGKAKKN